MAVGRFIVGPSRTPAAPVVVGFTVSRFLARGGSAQVWAAARESDGAPVALKVAFDEDPEVAERLTLEAETLRSLQHPHIVRLLDQTVTADERPVLVMELVEGSNLASHLPGDGFSFEETLRIFLPVLDAVGYAHSQGVIHRDLKPGNILIAPDGTPKVTDFGLARPVKDRLVAFALTRTGAVAGTVEYLPPEGYKPGYQPDTAADIYALGILLYEMLTGTPPRGAWRPLSTLKLLDVRLDELIAEAIAPGPRQRLKSAALFRRRLEIIRDSKPRYAGSPLLTRPVRVADAIWTVAGLYFLAAGYCTLERINNTDMPAVFDLTFGHSRLLGGFWATWVIGTAMGLLWLWQIIRLWRFRRVPLSESLPAPFGLKMMPSRGSRTLTAVTQVLCGWIPIILGILIAAETWQWLTDTPLWQRALAVTTWDGNSTVSMWHWDPAAFLDGGSYWIKDVRPDLNPGELREHDRQSFLVFTQPLLLSAGIACIALGMVVTFGRMVAAWWPSQKRALAAAASLTACASAGVTLDVRATLAERDVSRRSENGQEIARQDAAFRIASPVIKELFDQIYIHPDTSGALPATLRQSLAGKFVLDEQRLTGTRAVRAISAQQQDAIRQRRTVEDCRHFCGSGADGQFQYTVFFEQYTEPDDALATGSLIRLTIRGLLPPPTEGYITSWQTRISFPYEAEQRDLSPAEAALWVQSFLHCLNTTGCPDLESFLLHHIRKRNPAVPNQTEIYEKDTVCNALRAERARWDTLNIALAGPLVPRRLPGARWQFDIPLTQSAACPATIIIALGDN